jgi:hypothetical protein
MRDGNRLLLAAAWLGTAISAGLVSAWFLRTDPERVVEYRDRAAIGSLDRPGPAASDTAPTAIPLSPPAATTSSPSEVPPDALRNAGGAAAWIEAGAILPDGTPARGYVYALPAGSPGAEWGRILRVVLEPPGPCRLGLPDEGEYDVGFRSLRPQASVVLPALRVARGQVLPVAFHVPAGQPVTFVADPPCDPVLAGRGQDVFLQAELRTEDPGQKSLPGSGEPATVTETVRLCGTGPWRSEPLPVDREFQVRGVYSATLGSTMDLRERLVLSASTARAGEVIRLTRKPAAGLQLSFTWKSNPAPAWRGKTSVEGRILAAGESVPWDLRTEWDASGVQANHPFLLCPPGTARVEWKGSGILPGSLPVDLRTGDATRLDVPLEADPGAVRQVREPVRVVVEAVPPGPDPEGGKSLGFTAVLPGTPGKDPEVIGSRLEIGEERILDGEWRGVQGVVVNSGRWLVSRPLDVPAAGDLRVRLEPAGYLLAVPDTLLSDDLGALQVHSRDAWMYLHDWTEVYPEVTETPSPTVHVRTAMQDWPAGDGLDLVKANRRQNGAGVLLGPLPEGTFTFEVRLGGVRLPDATGRVPIDVEMRAAVS